MEFLNSKTYKNIYILFNETLQLKYRYALYSKIALNEGFKEISNIYMKLSLEKQEQATVWFNYLEKQNTTLNNLLLSIRLETNHKQLLERFACDAENDKFNKIAHKFRILKDVSSSNKISFNLLERNIKNNEVFKRYKKVEWECTKCGYIFIDYEPCSFCAICNKSKENFIIKQNIV